MAELEVCRIGWTSWAYHATSDRQQTLCGRRNMVGMGRFAQTVGGFRDWRGLRRDFPDHCCKVCAAAAGEDV